MAKSTAQQLMFLRHHLDRVQQMINAERRRRLASLPREYGFQNVREFAAAVVEATRSRAVHRKKYSFLLDNRLDQVNCLQQPAWAVNSASQPPSEPPSANASTPDISAVDLFAGAGGFSLAAKKAGIRVAAAVELSASACETYKANFITRRKTPPKLYEGDITSLDPAVLARETLLPTKHCDIIMGGPPCQGFSVHRINDAGVDDPRNDLLLRYFDFVRVLSPKVFVLENVPGMLWPRHAEYVKNFYLLAAAAGYDVKPPQVLNARDYGVPQNRKRVFVLGIRRGSGLDLTWPPPATHFAPDSLEVTDQKRPSWRLAADVFHAAPKGDMNDVHMNHSDELVAAFQSTPHNGGSRFQSNRQLACHADHDGHKDVYGRINPKTPGPTMTTACINPSKGRFLHPEQDHGITARQAARFQSFPDTFKFHGGLMASGVQIGNAVPIKLGVAVLRAIVAGLTKKTAAKEAA